MPQLDHVSYFSQFFWLSIFFLVFYLVLVQNYLPKVATILKVRKKLMNQSSLTSENKNDSLNFESVSSYDSVIVKGLKEAKEILAEASKESQKWTANTYQQIANKNLVSSQTRYVEALGEMLGKKYLVQSILK